MGIIVRFFCLLFWGIFYIGTTSRSLLLRDISFCSYLLTKVLYCIVLKQHGKKDTLLKLPPNNPHFQQMLKQEVLDISSITASRRVDFFKKGYLKTILVGDEDQIKSLNVYIFGSLKSTILLLVAKTSLFLSIPLMRR